jgi:gamma-F420-2:alpha-L-glutamate ligase
MKHKVIILTKQTTIEYETDKLLSNFIAAGINASVRHFNNFDIVVNQSIKYNGEDFDLPDLVLVRLGAGITSVELAVVRYFELLGILCVNSSTSVNLVQNKFHTSQILSQANIAVPTTMLVHFPITNNLIATHIGFPCVIKVLVGSFGEGVYLCHSEQEYHKLIEFLKNLDNEKKLLVQEFLNDQPGEDLRVFVVGDKVLGAMKRTAPIGDFRANITIGGKGEPYPVNAEIETIALATAKSLGLEIAGVDLLFDHRGFRVCEANSNPGFNGFDFYCKTDIASEIVNYVIKRLSE